MNSTPALLLGLAIAAGTSLGGYFVGHLVGQGFTDARALERTVTVKGLSEREVVADVAIWPLQFNVADNDLATLVQRLEKQTSEVSAFLAEHGFIAEEITIHAPNIVDKQAQNYGNNDVRIRYLAQRVVTVYTKDIAAVRAAKQDLLELGKNGVVFSQNDYQHQTQFLFQGLNEIKPEMIEEATRNARLVAEKFASDSESRLGKIKTARQGQFTIEDRDSNNPQIKKVRVVSTIEYYLSD
jgi:hypothetical protein